MSDGNLLGIDFHNLLDIKPLFRPLEKISTRAVINKPKFDNRGFVIIKGGNVIGSHSAFFNTKIKILVWRFLKKIRFQVFLLRCRKRNKYL